MHDNHLFQFLSCPWFYLSSFILLFSIPAFGAESIDGFRDLKFGMTPQEVQALQFCSTSHECIYELSEKNRYVKLTYDHGSRTQGSASPETLQLNKITIDMGQYLEDEYHKLQMIFGKTYHLTHDYTDDNMNAFLAKQLGELQMGYENGQVVLGVKRRQFGNLVLNVVYQNPSLAAEFIRQHQTLTSTTP